MRSEQLGNSIPDKRHFNEHIIPKDAGVADATQSDGGGGTA